MEEHGQQDRPELARSTQSEMLLANASLTPSENESLNSETTVQITVKPHDPAGNEISIGAMARQIVEEVCPG